MQMQMQMQMNRQMMMMMGASNRAASPPKPPRHTFPAAGDTVRMELSREGNTIRYQVVDAKSAQPRYLGQVQHGGEVAQAVLHRAFRGQHRLAARAPAPPPLIHRLGADPQQAGHPHRLNSLLEHLRGLQPHLLTAGPSLSGQSADHPGTS